jgi:hypothetical protein
MAFGMDQVARARGVEANGAQRGAGVGGHGPFHAAPGLPTSKQGRVTPGQIGGSRGLRAPEVLKGLRRARRLFDDLPKFKKTVTNPTQKT